ncbi:MAG: hypothetical protein QM500_18200 [Methylococcales bacterium]
MEFKTKFNKNDHVWYMKDNKPVEVIISAIEIFYVATNQDRIKYNAKDVINSRSWLDHTHLFEDMIFKTKDDLMKSLFSAGSVCKGRECSAVDGVGHSSECIQDHNDLYKTINA